MFQIVLTKTHYTKSGRIASQTREITSNLVSALEALRFRNQLNVRGTCAFLDDTKCYSYSIEENGFRLDFADVFRIVEGNEAYERIMNDIDPPITENGWLATK